MKPIVSKDKLLESGLQYGHQTRSWNPAMKPFIVMARKGIHIINLDRTTASLENAYNVTKKIAEKGGTFLFVGTTKQSSKTVKENAMRVGAFYIDHRWLGGILTNFKTIQKSINKLRRLERLEKNNFEGYTKKEAILMKKEQVKLEKVLGGIKFMRRIPYAIFVSSINNEDIAIKEAKKMGIPIFGIADTNVNPYDVNFPIFGNDDANKSTALVTTVIADAIAAAKQEEQLVAYVDDDKLTIMGLEPKKEFTPSEGNKYVNNKKPFIRKNNSNSNEEDNSKQLKTEVKVVQETKPVVEATVPEKNIEPLKEVETTKKVEQPTQVAKTKDDEILKEDKNAEKLKKEAEKQNQMREKLINKIKSNSDQDFSNHKLTELYGVGPKTEAYFIENKFHQIDIIAKLEESLLSEKFIANLPGIKSMKIEQKKDKILSIIKEAKFIIDNI